MSLPKWTRLLPSRSLYAGVLVTMTVTISVSFLVFDIISNRLQNQSIEPIFSRMDDLQLDDARESFETGGKPSLGQYLSSLDARFGGAHYLLDARGIDLVTGQDRSVLLPAQRATHSHIRSRGHWVFTDRSEDGQFWFAGEGELGGPQVWTFLPFYFLVLGVTGFLCWLASIAVISPIRRISEIIEAFGRDSLSARTNLQREDEIGTLGRSFDRMADRLERLIVGERRLLADMSHELRSPLARLTVAAKLARKTGNSGALDRIERDIERMTSLVSDILEMNAMECDPTLQEGQRISIGEIVGEVVRDCSVEAEYRGCSIQAGGRIPSYVNGDPELIRRAIENILRNAIRYSPRDAAVQVMLSERDDAAQVEIRDSGPGVPAEALQRIFDPFFRVDPARTADGGGSGLGLSIAKRAVLLHQGKIDAENASPGLRVRMSFPLHPARAT